MKETSKKSTQTYVRVGYGVKQWMTVQTQAANVDKKYADKKYVLGAHSTS